MEHRLGLNAAKADMFWCPINKFALQVGFRLEGTLPLGADLRYIVNGITSGKLIDVNGTVIKSKKKDVKISGQEKQPGDSRGDLQEGSQKPESADYSVAQDEPSKEEGNENKEIEQPEKLKQDQEKEEQERSEESKKNSKGKK